ncbi:MAG TPA: DnaJ domain-containing protein [Cyclobacteriaceae bacterium]
MINYYAILDIDRNANSTEIRAAYKRQAMVYHPDRNAGEKEAEEHFKMVNEAYHVLSDSLKKAKYDSWLDPHTPDQFSDEYWREVRKRRYYAYRRAQTSTYRIDRDYYQVQALAFLVFLLLSGLCFAMIHTVNYFIDLRQASEWRENSLHLKQVNALFDAGHFNEAFSMIKGLRKDEPLEFRFMFAQDSLLSELRQRAEREFNNKNFEDASHYYTILGKEENPVRMETLQKIASCQYYLGNFGESLHPLKHLLNQQPWNLDLVYRIAMINLDNLDNKREALHYLTMGKRLFKKNLTEVYGAAFEVVMDPSDVPEIYYYIFIARAKANIGLQNYTEAITDCNWAVTLRSNKAEPYHLRAISKFRNSRYRSGCEDLTRAALLGMDVQTEMNRHCR